MEVSNLIVLHVAPIGCNRSSGLLYAIPPLVSNQNKINDIKAALLLTSYKTVILPEDYDFPIFKPNKKYKYNLNELPSPFNNPDLVIFHSTYILTHFKIAIELRKKGIPYIIVPHGGMTKGAQSKKALKKKIGNLIFYNNFVKGALALHCLTQGEADETKYWNKEMFVVGNGMSIPADCEKNYSKDNKTVNVSFIGRLDLYHKGLDLLIAAINKASENIRKSNFCFNIYGPDYFGSKKVLNKQIYENKIQDIVKIYEPVFDDKKDYVLRNTDIFVHTSRFEGHPMSILEAMSYRIPCMVTPETNMSQDILEADAGWIVELSEESIANGINMVIQEKDLIKEKGLNARNLIKNKYSWDKIALQTVRYYTEFLKCS